MYRLGWQAQPSYEAGIGLLLLGEKLTYPRSHRSCEGQTQHSGQE